MLLTRRRAVLTAAALATPALPALAQPRFPERPIELVVGFTAGGGTDLMARAYARFLEQRLGGSVIVLNRPGAGVRRRGARQGAAHLRRRLPHRARGGGARHRLAAGGRDARGAGAPHRLARRQ